MPSTTAPPDENPGRLALPAAFSCSVIDGDPDAACVHVVGELDIATAPQLELALHQAQSQARLVVLDLSELAFIDGTGVRSIVNATFRARKAGRRLVLVHGPAHVERLFELTGAAEQLERGHAGQANGALRALQVRRGRSIRHSAGLDLRGADATGLPTM